MSDTSPVIAELMHQKLMALTGAERFRMGANMFTTARRIVLSSLPGNLTPLERKRLLYKRVYGEDLPDAVR